MFYLTEFDSPLEKQLSFGNSRYGYIIEAVLRTACEWMTGDVLEDIEFYELRGIEGIRKATVKIGQHKLNIGIASGLGNSRVLLEEMEGKSDYHAIEIMACPEVV